jgi:two-component system, NarL family, nitrate/nitrite response regulator NarL
LDTPRHLFLSQNGVVLPRWREAFPAAEAAKQDEIHRSAIQADLVWLRLQPGLSVAQQLRDLRILANSAVCIALSDTPNDSEALEAFVGGARGYCNTHSTPMLLQQVATVIGQGGMWIGQSLMQRLLSMSQPIGSKAAGRSDWAEVLTSRELQVARTLASGASNKEIAGLLGITERTVKAHVGAILEKLDVRDRLQLAMLIRDEQDA